MKKRLLYISSVPLENKTGGSVVMYHHLSQQDDFEVLEINNLSLSLSKSSLLHRMGGTCFARLSRTRWHKWARAYEQLWRDPTLPGSLLSRVRQFNPDVVLTVAHGNLFWLARATAQQLELPLVSIYHDWWPMLLQQNSSLHSPVLEVVTRRFRQLYFESDCALCIAEGMKKALGEHPNSHVLYPATSNQLAPISITKAFENDRFTLLYSGNVSDSYGQKLRALIRAQHPHSSIDLEIYGNPHDWPKPEKVKACHQKTLRPFIPTSRFSETLSAASALLTVISFEPEVAKLMSTNFPSKIATYAVFGKPLVVWAPPYSTAAQFVRQHDCGLLIEDPSPDAVWQALTALSQNPEQQSYLAERAVQLHRNTLNPGTVHRKFVQHIEAVCEAVQAG